MVSEGKGRAIPKKRRQIPSLPTQRPWGRQHVSFKSGDTIFVKVSFVLGDSKLLVEKGESPLTKKKAPKILRN